MHLRPLLLLCAGLLAAAGARAASRPVVIDPTRSHIDIAVKATVDSFTGKLDRYEAKVLADPDQGRIVAVSLAFKFADVKTGKDKRDEKMHEWQDTPHHPDGVFTLTKLEPATGDRWQATGRLDFHGVSKVIEFPVAVTTDRHVYAIDGEAQLDTRDFGLPIIKMMAFLKVDPLVQVRFHLQGTAQ